MGILPCMSRRRTFVPTDLGSPSPLEAWLQRATPLDSFHVPSERQPDLDSGCWISIEMIAALHEAATIPPQSLRASWFANKEYVSESLRIIDSDEPLWIDRDEAEMIREALGPPPPNCCPIYFISARDGATERLVYIGKTSARTQRFRAGHSAITQLHDPKYAGMTKRLLLARVLFTGVRDYLPIEFVAPLSRAESLLTSIESQLIFELQPELNVAARRFYRPASPMMITIANHIPGESFLRDRTLFGR